MLMGFFFMFVDFRRESNSSRREKFRVSLAAPVKRISWNRFLSTRLAFGISNEIGIGFYDSVLCSYCDFFGFSFLGVVI